MPHNKIVFFFGTSQFAWSVSFGLHAGVNCDDESEWAAYNHFIFSMPKESPIIISYESTLSRIPCSVFIVSTLHSDFVRILFMMKRSTWRSPLQSIRSTISCVYVISIEKFILWVLRATTSMLCNFALSYLHRAMVLHSIFHKHTKWSRQQQHNANVKE